jgi:hypothetical protein
LRTTSSTGVDELRALGVVTLGPVVAGAGLAEHEVVGAEDLAEGAGADGVHGAGLEVHQHGAGHVAACARERGKREGSGSARKKKDRASGNSPQRRYSAFGWRSGGSGARTAGRLVVVDVDALQLEVGVTAVGAGGVDTVLIADNLWSRGRRSRVSGDAGKKEKAHSSRTRPTIIARRIPLSVPKGARVHTSQNLAPIWLPHWPP